MCILSSSYCPRTNIGTEVPCQPGTYATSNSSKCTFCPPGYECPNIDQAVVYVLCLLSIVISFFYQRYSQIR